LKREDFDDDVASKFWKRQVQQRSAGVSETTRSKPPTYQAGPICTDGTSKCRGEGSDIVRVRRQSLWGQTGCLLHSIELRSLLRLVFNTAALRSTSQHFQLLSQSPMNHNITTTRGVMVASRLLDELDKQTGPDWKFENLLGRFVELSGPAASATLTTTAALILQAQLLDEPVAWVAVCESTFFPPDFAASGVDLGALPVIRINDLRKAVRVADRLLRSGGFALVVMDLGTQNVLQTSAQTRLAALAQKYNAALLCLTRKEPESPSLGSLVSSRASVCRARTDFNRFECELRVVKDKRRGPGWRRKETCRGPAGLC